MKTTGLVRLALVGLAAGLGFWPFLAHASGDDAASVGRFEQRIAVYMALRQGVADRLQSPEISRDLGKIHREVEMFADALRQARPDAQRGDLLTADISDVIRRRVRVTLRQSGFDPADLLRELTAESKGAARPAVNGRFAWATATPMLPCLLLALPELPDALQYRFVGGDLVLVDTDASLILDVLPGVLEPTLSS